MAKRPEVMEKLQELSNRIGGAIPADRITINRWRPDTCGCVIEQWFDDDNPGVVEYAFTLRTCSDHQAAVDRPLWVTINGENGRKNRAKAVVAAALNRENVDDVFSWEFDPDTRLADGHQRRLVVTVRGANNSQQSQAQALLDTQFGPGSVEVRRG